VSPASRVVCRIEVLNILISIYTIWAILKYLATRLHDRRRTSISCERRGGTRINHYCCNGPLETIRPDRLKTHEKPKTEKSRTSDTETATEAIDAITLTTLRLSAPSPTFVARNAHRWIHNTVRYDQLQKAHRRGGETAIKIRPRHTVPTTNRQYSYPFIQRGRQQGERVQNQLYHQTEVHPYFRNPASTIVKNFVTSQWYLITTNIKHKSLCRIAVILTLPYYLTYFSHVFSLFS